MARISEENRLVLHREMYANDLAIAGEKLGELCVKVLVYIRSCPRERAMRNILITMHLLFHRFIVNR